jgi:hypothetical protein
MISDGLYEVSGCHLRPLHAMSRPRLNYVASFPPYHQRVVHSGLKGGKTCHRGIVLLNMKSSKKS